MHGVADLLVDQTKMGARELDSQIYQPSHVGDTIWQLFQSVWVVATSAYLCLCFHDCADGPLGAFSQISARTSQIAK
jgi:hypothetical protein